MLPARSNLVMQTRNCQNCKNDFNIEPDDFSFYEKIKVPPPTFCPECRMQRRLAWRNELGLFRRKCNAPGHEEVLISMYPENSPVTVYDHDFYHSDSWDPISYGQDYDFSTSFFSQFKELMNKVPLISLFDSKSINTNYCNITVGHKNCYLVSAGWDNEDSMYSNRISYCKDTLDSYICHRTEFSYENVFCKDSNRLFYSRNSENCTDSYFLYDCRGCTDCIGCTNLRNKSYCIFNQQYSKEEYQEWKKSYNLGDKVVLDTIKEEFNKLYDQAIHRFAHLIKTDNVIGDNIENSRNCYWCFDMAGEVDGAKYCNWGTYGLTDSYDTGPGTGGKSELTYEGISIGVANSKCAFGVIIWNCQNVYYSMGCENCSNCFGCVSLKGKSYCIFNKQYTKEEYDILIPKIMEQMSNVPYISKAGHKYYYGEFFPIELSPYSYNSTVGQDYMPIAKNEAMEAGYLWQDQKEIIYTPTIASSDLPNTINEVSDQITQEIISCENSKKEQGNCSKAFKITKNELEFYHRFNIPLPHFCFNCRHSQRLSLRNPYKLWHRSCMCEKEGHSHEGKCEVEFETSYASDRPEKVFCESCYQKEVL